MVIPSTVSAGPQPITDALIQDAITRAVQNVCRTMMRHEAKLTERVSAEVLELAPPAFEVIGNVGFVGRINGLVYLGMKHDFAVFAVGSILGMSPAEVQMEGPEVIRDAIGEMTNMIAGGFKNALCDVGFPCKLTLPTIVRGNNLTVAAIKGATRQGYRFECGGFPLLADLHFKAE